MVSRLHMGTQIHIIHLWNGTLSGEKQLRSWEEKLLICLNSQVVSNQCSAPIKFNKYYFLD